jgi:hypothetical protein
VTVLFRGNSRLLPRLAGPKRAQLVPPMFTP